MTAVARNKEEFENELDKQRGDRMIRIEEASNCDQDERNNEERRKRRLPRRSDEEKNRLPRRTTLRRLRRGPDESASSRPRMAINLRCRKESMRGNREDCETDQEDLWMMEEEEEQEDDEEWKLELAEDMIFG